MKKKIYQKMNEKNNFYQPGIKSKNNKESIINNLKSYDFKYIREYSNDYNRTINYETEPSNNNYFTYYEGLDINNKTIYNFDKYKKEKLAHKDKSYFSSNKINSFYSSRKNKNEPRLKSGDFYLKKNIKMEINPKLIHFIRGDRWSVKG